MISQTDTRDILLEVGSAINSPICSIDLPNGWTTITLSFFVTDFTSSTILYPEITSILLSSILGAGNSLGSSKPLIAISYACDRLHFWL